MFVNLIGNTIFVICLQLMDKMHADEHIVPKVDEIHKRHVRTKVDIYFFSSPCQRQCELLQSVQTSGKSTMKLKSRNLSECIITKKYFNKSVIIIKEQLMNSKLYTIKITWKSSSI